MNTQSPKTKFIKDKISSSGSKLMSVKFIKKDGTLRTMTFNPRTTKGIKGEKASECAKQALKTRKANNPNLISVCDQSLLAKGDLPAKCYRSVNCDTVIEMKINGKTFTEEDFA